jgi:hypothetical protein
MFISEFNSKRLFDWHDLQDIGSSHGKTQLFNTKPSAKRQLGVLKCTLACAKELYHTNDDG